MGVGWWSGGGGVGLVEWGGWSGGWWSRGGNVSCFLAMTNFPLQDWTDVFWVTVRGSCPWSLGSVASGPVVRQHAVVGSGGGAKLLIL